MQLEDKEKDRQLKKYEIDMDYQIELLKLENSNGQNDLALKIERA